MWEKIKNFFKWIPDHTGISWIAKKIKSGLEWLFGGKASANQEQKKKSSDIEMTDMAEGKEQEHDQSKDLTPPGPEISGGDNSNQPVEQNEHREPVEPSAAGKSEETSSGNHLKVDGQSLSLDTVLIVNKLFD